MLVKSHNIDYLEDFGLVDDSMQQVYLYELGRKVSFLKKSNAFSRVIKVKAFWMDRDIKLDCFLADTQEKRIAGLSNYESISNKEALFFPYEPYTDVSFHQGGVKYPLDIIFMRDENIVKIVKDTKVGSRRKWSCEGCTGVLEVNGGFCDINGVKVGDRVLLSAVSKVDLREVNNEQSS